MHRLSCYGLEVCSEVEIPEFVSVSNPSETVDVEIRLGVVGQQWRNAATSREAAIVSPDTTYFYWGVAGDYLVRGGETITIDPAPGAEPESIRLPLLGIVFGALLAQRNLQVLHASAVNIEGNVVGLVGNKMVGKSTTAAILHQAGHRAVADDVLALQPSEGAQEFDMLPAFPHLKLWPQAMTSLGEDPEDHPLLHSRVAKRSFALRDTFPTAPLPMARLYILDWGESTTVEEMSEADAFRSLVPHTFASRYEPDTPETMKKLLESCSASVKGIPTKRLVRKRDLSDLDSIVRVIERDLSIAS